MLDVGMVTSGRILQDYCPEEPTTPSKITGIPPYNARLGSNITPNTSPVLSSGPSLKNYHSPPHKNPNSTIPPSCYNPAGSDTRVAISCWSCLSFQSRMRFQNPHRSFGISMIRSIAMISITSPRDLLIRN